MRGEGVEKNEEEAYVWYKKAAENGDSLGAYFMGLMYYNGERVEKNDLLAFP